MSQTSHLAINTSSWTQVPGITVGDLFLIQAKYSFYYVYSNSSPDESGPIDSYLIEDSLDNSTKYARLYETSLGSLWIKSKDQNQVISYTYGTVSTSGGLTDAQLRATPVPVVDSAVTSLSKNEDAVHSTGDSGLMFLGVANEADAARSGTDGDYTPLSTDRAGNVNVIPRSGLVRVSVQSSGLTTASTAYVAGDQLGNQFTFAGCARKSGGTGFIRGVMIIDAADVIGPVDLVVTRSSVTLAADNAPYAISDADALNVVAVIQTVGSFDIGNNRVCQAFNLAIPYDCSGGTSLFGGLITRAGHTFFGAATNIQVILFVEPN